MDAFRNQILQGAQDTSGPDLGRQSCGRAFTDTEMALADAMMAIYGTGVSDPAGLAAELTKKGINAPMSGRSDWTADLLADELAAINADLDAAYQESGYGA
ncbi:recombinase-like helix-turn-helix domain-containing protein [Pacificibacter sp. AS14]|uniref:recombinase-like helix-turn-helix domain-containing protein n=1 Tax=Pacificibacter sp. AS14 TaxID=3135785 RepID=UPI00317E58C8